MQFNGQKRYSLEIQKEKGYSGDIRCICNMKLQKMINVTCTTELNRQKAIAASARTALSATDNNSTTSDNNYRPRTSNRRKNTDGPLFLEIPGGPCRSSIAAFAGPPPTPHVTIPACASCPPIRIQLIECCSENSSVGRGRLTH